MVSNEEWCAVILAGGLGTRLAPLTTYICKPMVPVTNKPMVDYAIDHLRYAGIKHIIIVVKHLGDELRALIQSTWTDEVCKKLGIKIDVPKVDSLGTADAVRKVYDLIDTPQFVVSMADIITNLPMEQFMKFHKEKNAQATVSMKHIDQYATKYGNTILGPDAKIKLFMEKPDPEEIYISSLIESHELLPIINTGIYCFKKEIADLLMDTDLMDFGSEVFPYLLENKYDLYGFVEDYYWMDIGNPLTYLWANWDMLRLYGWPIQPAGIRIEQKHLWTATGKVPEGIDLAKEICIGDNFKYGKNCKVNELTTIGKNVTIGDNVVLERCVIWDNVKIGSNCKIVNSIICNNVEISDNVTVQSESVIGPNCKISKNLVLDAKTVKAESKL